jgi:cAMP-dependent protein kinase regulator
MLDLISSVAGRTFVEKALERGCDRLYWEERELANEYLISPLKRGKKLTAKFRITRENLLSMLREIAIFSELSQQELSLMSSRLQMERYRKGSEIVRQGDMGNKFYIIDSGKVEVAVHDNNSAMERIVANLSQGDYFGEIALIGEVPRTATCRATTPVWVWVLDKGDFNQLVRSHLDLPEKLDRAVTNMTMLKRMPLFRELTYKQINMISSMLESRVVPSRTVIIREGEPGDAFYITKSGKVMVTARTDAGEKTVGVIGEAEYFGEIALITDQPRIATVTSISETELLILQKRNFDAVFELISSELEQAGSRRMLDTRHKLRASPSVRETETNIANLS